MLDVVGDGIMVSAEKHYTVIFATFVYTLFQIEIIKTNSLEQTSRLAKSHL